LNELHSQTKDEEIWFWGKIFGTEFDYFIALGINYKDHYEFPEKKLYYATTSNYIFASLPATFDYHDIDFKESYLNPFTGAPNTIITKYKEEVDPDAVGGDVVEPINPSPDNQTQNPNADLDDSQPEIPVAKIEKENFTELLKLSLVVKCIDHDTNVVPQGAFRLIPIHEIRRDQSWKGMKPEELQDLSKFHHFRKITNPENKIRIETDEAIFYPDLLDTINEDEVKYSWSIQLDSTKTIV
jgi:radial spoke head protein 9